MLPSRIQARAAATSHGRVGSVSVPLRKPRTRLTASRITSANKCNEGRLGSSTRPLGSIRNLDMCTREAWHVRPCASNAIRARAAKNIAREEPRASASCHRVGPRCAGRRKDGTTRRLVFEKTARRVRSGSCAPRCGIVERPTRRRCPPLSSDAPLRRPASPSSAAAGLSVPDSCSTTSAGYG